MRQRTTILAAPVVAAILVAGTLGASAASMEKSIEVAAPAAKVWDMIGPFCAIKDWHPAVGKCTENGDVRTLVTKDGKETFVEKRTASDDKAMMYTYAIETSPLPVTDYKATIKVTPLGKDMSKVEWSSTYTPNSGAASGAAEALGGIYQAGLDRIKKMAGG